MNQSLDLIRRYLRAAWRRRWIGLGAAWLVCLAGWAGVHQIKDEYQVRARLYVDADAVLTPLLRGIAVDSNPNDQISRLQRTLLSRPNLQTLISKTDLGLAATTADERERLIRRLGTRIKVQSQDKNLFSIEYENADPRLARDVVQTLLSIFTESATSSNRSEMENAQLFLQRQIVSYEKQLHSMEERRAAFRAKYAGVLPVDGVAGGTVETARDAVSRMEVQLQDAEAREAQLQARLKGMPQTLSAGVAGPGGIAPLAQAEAKLSELRTLYTDDYPGVIEQKKLIEQMRRAPEPAQGGTGGGVGLPNQLYDQLVVKLVDEQSNVASLTRQLQAARVSFARIQQIRHDQPSLLAEYENLNRDYGVLRKNYDELVGRLQAATISEAANTQADKVHLRVVDPPEVPLLPIAPNRPLLMTGVLIAGIGVGLGVAVLLAELDSSFTSLDDLRALGLPVLGGLSAIGGPGPRRRVVAGVQFAVGFVLLIGLYGGLVVHTLRASGTV
jgi:polysaccharide chain length determinant protein (PEP-CTERM system associated)